MNYYLDFNDKRLPFVYQMLIEQGYKAFKLDFENTKSIKKGDVVVLSPAFKWKEENAKALPDEVIVVCGKVSEDVLNILKQKNSKQMFINRTVLIDLYITKMI